MFRRIPSFVLWIVLACAIAALPMACGSSGSSSDGATQDGTFGPSSMTQG